MKTSNCEMCGMCDLVEETTFGASDGYCKYLLCNDCAEICGDFVQSVSKENHKDQPVKDYPSGHVVSVAGEAAGRKRDDIIDARNRRPDHKENICRGDLGLALSQLEARMIRKLDKIREQLARHVEAGMGLR